MPDNRPRKPPAIDRRRLLVAMGFGAANFAALRALDPDRPSSVEVAGIQQRPANTVTPSDGTVNSGTSSGSGAVQPTLADSTTTSAAPPSGPPQRVDLAITGGRVIDPETGMDEIANIGIIGREIAYLGNVALEADETIDATGQAVSPGFIDILSYEPNPYGIWFKVADGVTSNLGMHGINERAANFVAEYSGQSPCHFGGAVDDAYLRGAAFGRYDIGIGDEATPWQIGQLADIAREDLANGHIGINFEPEYTPGITPYAAGANRGEIFSLAQVAQESGAGCYFHVRYSDDLPPGTNEEALTEVINIAKDTGVSVHIEHINSTGGTYTMAASLQQIEDARDAGYDVTACVYPYTFWATTLGAARFDAGWQERFRIDVSDLRIPGRPNERVTDANFGELRSENLLVAAMGAIPRPDLELALQVPWMLVASDAILEVGNNNHPRSTGTFARTLGYWVREQGVLSLPEALAKMTINPAKRLEGGCPAFAKKGRLQVGMDADITIFDPATVIDSSNVDDPARESVGITWVLVDGQIVRRDGLNQDVLAGRAMTA